MSVRFVDNKHLRHHLLEINERTGVAADELNRVAKLMSFCDVKTLAHYGKASSTLSDIEGVTHLARATCNCVCLAKLDDTI